MPTAVNSTVTRLVSVVAILAVCGIAVSSVSLQHHYAKSKTEFCDIGDSFNCDLVNRSEYSEILGIPVALVGMLGYGAIAGLATVYRARRETPLLILGGAAAGLAFALYLTHIEARVLGVWCIMCLSSLGLITAITVVAGVLWAKSRKEDL
ncbi:MAG TPA: vitamin K epoxide reductase family protein [Terriglobales bacterium]|nr:vitamin K epoxide reductase family protein [Terriglobales bacterium]